MSMRTGLGNKGRLRRSVMSHRLIAMVRRVFLLDGRPFVDAWNPLTGETLPVIPVATTGGGTSTFSHAPIAVDPNDAQPSDPDTSGGAQIIVDMEGDKKIPYCVGTVHHSGLRLVAETEAPGGDADRTREVGIADYGMGNGGTRAVIDERGAMMVDTNGAADPVVRFQMDPAGYLRVSINGSASERLMLAGPTISKLNQMQDKINEIETRLETAESIPAGGPLVLTPTDSLVSMTAAGDSLKAKAIRVSSEAEG